MMTVIIDLNGHKRSVQGKRSKKLRYLYPFPFTLYPPKLAAKVLVARCKFTEPPVEVG
jgi:hypothetical protein